MRVRSCPRDARRESRVSPAMEVDVSCVQEANIVWRRALPLEWRSFLVLEGRRMGEAHGRSPRLPRASAARFALAFGLTSAILLGFYYFPYPEQSPVRAWIDGFLHRYAASAGVVLKFFDPQLTVVGQDIVGRYSLRIVKTCDAMDVTILLISAILAWPSPWKRRIAASLASALALYVLNVVRICSLYFIGLHFPSFFEFAHLDVWPALILVLAVGAFLRITAFDSKALADEAT